MRIAYIHGQTPSLEIDPIANPIYLKPFGKSLGDSNNGIGYEGPDQSMQGPGSFLFRFSPDLNGFTFDLHFDMVRVIGYLEVSLVPLHYDIIGIYYNVNPSGKGYRLNSYA
jgi:hypothetical protein